MREVASAQRRARTDDEQRMPRFAIRLSFGKRSGRVTMPLDDARSIAEGVSKEADADRG